MTKLRNSLILAAAAALLCLPMSAAADTTVKADLREQNGSGASGSASLTALSDGGLKVVIHSEGLVPGQPHPQHLHGSAHGGHFGCPTLDKNDKDGDGVLTNEYRDGLADDHADRALDRRPADAGHLGSHRCRVQPRHRPPHRPRRAGLGERGRGRGRRPPGPPSPPWRHHLALPAGRGAVRASASCSTRTATSWPRSSPASTARSSPTRAGRSPAGWRSSSSPAGSRICSRAATPRAGLHRRRRLLGPPAAGRRRRDHTVQLPRDGAAVDVRRAVACGNTFVLKPSEKDPSASLRWRAVAEAGLPDGVFNVVHGDKVAVDALLDPPGRQGVSLRRAPRRSPATSTRPARRMASGCRPSAARRTTWSCSPTPTSSWPPTPP